MGAIRGDTICGDTASQQTCIEAQAEADRERAKLFDSADKADKAYAMIAEGKEIGLFSGIYGFKMRFERSYGALDKSSMENLKTYAGMAREAADYIGAAGEGVTIESASDWEAWQKAVGRTDSQINKAAIEAFGSNSFTSSTFTAVAFLDRGDFAAFVTGGVGNGGPIVLEHGWISRNNIFAHEASHSDPKLHLHDQNDLAYDWYFSLGVADALRVGKQWDNAESLACVLGGCW